MYNPMRTYPLAFNLTVAKHANCLNNCSSHGACSEVIHSLISMCCRLVQPAWRLPCCIVLALQPTVTQCHGPNAAPQLLKNLSCQLRAYLLRAVAATTPSPARSAAAVLMHILSVCRTAIRAHECSAGASPALQRIADGCKLSQDGLCQCSCQHLHQCPMHQPNGVQTIIDV